MADSNVNRLAQASPPSNPHQPQGCHGYYIHSKEDEMVTIHSAGKYVETFYAGDPEQANDFVKKFHKMCFRTIEEAWQTFVDFKATWKSKYPFDES